MAGDAPKLIDGYTYVQALRQGNAPVREFRPRPPRARPPAPPPRKPRAEAPAPPPHAGHTVMPVRFDIICYDCGYAYSMQGRIYKALCPKCRKFLDATDVVVDAEWQSDVRTIGTFTVHRTGVVRKASIVATDIVLAGDVRDATLRAMRRLEIRPGATFDLAQIAMRDILVHEGAELAPPNRLACRNVEVAGTLRARLDATGQVTIRPGGVLIGEVCGAHLVVEEGGGLRARVSIRSTPAAAAVALQSAA